MTEPTRLTTITKSLIQITLKDGAIPEAVDMPNLSKIPRAVVSRMDTSLEVVYYKRCRAMLLCYPTLEAAQAAVTALSGTTVKGVKLGCRFQEDRSTIPSRKALKFHAHLNNAIDNILSEDIAAQLPENLRRPKFVFLATKIPSDAAMTASIRQYVKTAIDGICTFNPMETTNGKKLKMEVHFEPGAQDTTALLATLNGSEVGGHRIFVVERLTVHLRIDHKVYLRHSKALKGIAGRAWKDSSVKMHIYDGRLRTWEEKVIVSLAGTDRQKVARVKSDIDHCIAKDTNVALLWDRYELPQIHETKLNSIKDYRAAVNGGGLRRLREFFGEEAVTFDDDGDIPTVAIKASLSEWIKAKKLLQPQLPESLGTCEICTEDNVELLKTPGCGHSACQTCLVRHCEVETNRPLKCFACGTLIPAVWLTENLPKANAQDLFHSIVKEYCKQNQDQYVPCAALDCDEHLETSTHFHEVVCPKCLSSNCTTCRSLYHFTKTCAQYQDELADEKKETEQQLLDAVGAKRCPGCNTPCEKVDGCNHIQCTECNAHWCWVCRLACPNANLVYRHLDDVHGGNGLQDGAVLLQQAREAVAEGAVQLVHLEPGIRRALADLAQDAGRAANGPMQ